MSAATVQRDRLLAQLRADKVASRHPDRRVSRKRNTELIRDLVADVLETRWTRDPVLWRARAELARMDLAAVRAGNPAIAEAVGLLVAEWRAEVASRSNPTDLALARQWRQVTALVEDRLELLYRFAGRGWA